MYRNNGDSGAEGVRVLLCAHHNSTAPAKNKMFGDVCIFQNCCASTLEFSHQRDSPTEPHTHCYWTACLGFINITISALTPLIGATLKHLLVFTVKKNTRALAFLYQICMCVLNVPSAVFSAGRKWEVLGFGALQEPGGPHGCILKKHTSVWHRETNCVMRASAVVDNVS